MSEDAHNVEKLGCAVRLEVEIPANSKEGIKYARRLQEASGAKVSFVRCGKVGYGGAYTSYSSCIRASGTESQIQRLRESLAKIGER